MKIRLVDNGSAPGALNMGIDEALVAGVSAGTSPPTLRLYRWEPACVTVGYFQSMAEEVDLRACAAAGVDAVRRVTGGGAVFHEAEITYSLVIPEGEPLAPPDILASYRRVCSGLIAGLGFLGVEASFAPINDIVVMDGVFARKVSGNAQTRKQGCLLQHGTVLLDLEVERMFSLLKVPSEKLKGKLVETVKERVTSLRRVLGRETGYAEAALALARGFAAAFEPYGATFERGELGEAELELAERLASEKYSRREWNLKR